MTKICIVAAGLATRLQPLTNYIPKILINVGKQTGLVEMINYWKEYADDFIVIIHPKYEELVRAYYDMYFANDSEISLTIKTIDTALGTAHTIDSTLDSSYHGDDILFTWSDIIPIGRIDEDVLKSDKTTILTVNNQKNRYKVVDDTMIITPDASGDVIGLYYVPNYVGFEGEYVEGQDLADVLAHRGNLQKYELESILDFGDKEKLFDVLQLADEAREFNAVEFAGDYVRKYSLNFQGHGLIEKEINWYEEVFKQNCHVNVPKVYPHFTKHEFMMDKVNGCAVFKRFKELKNHDHEQEVVGEIMKELFYLHLVDKEVPNEQVIADVKKEAHDKLLTRYAEIERVINAFGKNIRIVNGLPINNNLNEVVGLLFDKIKAQYANTNRYSLIHGDLQFSNSMIDYKEFEITFIDPRGYFGNTPLYGLPDYDIAKVLYSLSGYDTFNYSDSFYISDISEKSIDFTIDKMVLSGSEEEIKKHITNYFKPIHYYWLAIIWIGLAGYIKNNPVKSLAAHYHGLYLAERVLKGEFNGILH